MRILTLGDIVGTRTIDYLQRNLWQIRREHHIDATIANGENTSEIRGLSAHDAAALLDTGIDLITLGNHAFGMRDIYSYLENETRVIRPANYPPVAPGAGYAILNVDGWRILCINVCGRVYMDPLASPFDTVDRILSREAGAYDFSVMDIHAEATSEKLALAYYFDGRVQVMFGTHTHVPTADAQILSGGSGYVTDLGMCGPRNSILGVKSEIIIEKLRSKMPARFEFAEGDIMFNGVIFDVETNGNKTTVNSVKRVEF